MTFTTILELTLGDQAQIYAEGWQSWSPTTWWTHTSENPDHAWQHTMRFRPGTSTQPGTIQGEGLLVVDPADGTPLTRITCPTHTGAIPTIRALRHDLAMTIQADAPVLVSTHPTRDDAFTTIPWLPTKPPRPAPTVWCSWYTYFENVTSTDITTNLAAITTRQLPVDTIQIDDGWSHGWGHYLTPHPRFGSLPDTIDTIRSAGHPAGLWLAPFLIGRSTPMATEHPDWLTTDAGHNWRDELVGLDLAHPAVQEHLHSTTRQLVELGIDYLKLDFLYAGALPTANRDREEAAATYREGLAIIREAAGPNTYLLGCGAPIIPSIGHLDAMRIAPDTFHEDAQEGSAGMRGAPNLVARAWQHGRLWANDPDCIIMRPAFALREPWRQLNSAWGGLRSISDNINELDVQNIETVRRHLETPVPTTLEPFTTRSDHHVGRLRSWLASSLSAYRTSLA